MPDGGGLFGPNDQLKEWGQRGPMAKKGRGRSGSLGLGQPYEISESCGGVKSVLCVRGLALQACTNLLGGAGPDNH